MPIKPENRCLYPAPKEWKAIRAEVLERAGNRCEWEGCELPNGQWGLRDLAGQWWPSDDFAEGRMPEDTLFERDGQTPRMAYRIVLTIAHRDHNPGNNGEPGNRPNLAAWCQYHHLAYDRAHHMENARLTRDNRRGRVALPLFETSGASR